MAMARALNTQGYAVQVEANGRQIQGGDVGSVDTDDSIVRFALEQGWLGIQPNDD